MKKKYRTAAFYLIQKPKGYYILYTAQNKQNYIQQYNEKNEKRKKKERTRYPLNFSAVFLDSRRMINLELTIVILSNKIIIT